MTGWATRIGPVVAGCGYVTVGILSVALRSPSVAAGWYGNNWIVGWQSLRANTEKVFTDNQ